MHLLTKKQAIDQSAHLVVGALGTAAIAMVFPEAPLWSGFVTMMAAAFAREVIQHEGFDLGWGSALDLLFFAIGGGSALWLMG